MSKIEILKGDITKIAVDAIVNAANTSLLGGGGVDGAIHRAGGPKILEECRVIRARQGGCATGKAVITSGGDLPAQYVIHTVGPVWNNDNKEKVDQFLKNSYLNSLKLAVKNNVNSIAFPNISTGVYRFPKDRAARIAIETVQSYFLNESSIKRLIFVCFDEENYQLYRQTIKA